MKYIAIYATDKPLPDPGLIYAALPVAGTIVYVRALDVSDRDEPLDDACDAAMPGETILNTIEIE